MKMEVEYRSVLHIPVSIQALWSVRSPSGCMQSSAAAVHTGVVNGHKGGIHVSYIEEEGL